MKYFSIEKYNVYVDAIKLSGYDEGDDVVQVASLADSMQHRVGADGTMTAYKVADQSAELTVRLAQSSESNALLDGLLALQNTGDFTPIQIVIKDLNGTDTILLANCYIKRHPDVVRGTGPNGHEWVFVSEERSDALAGSPTV